MYPLKPKHHIFIKTSRSKKRVKPESDDKWTVGAIFNMKVLCEIRWYLKMSRIRERVYFTLLQKIQKSLSNLPVNFGLFKMMDF